MTQKRPTVKQPWTLPSSIPFKPNQAGLLALLHYLLRPSRYTRWPFLHFHARSRFHSYSGGSAGDLHPVPYSPLRAPNPYKVLPSRHYYIDITH